MLNRFLGSVVAVGVLAGALSLPGHAQTYPTKPVKMVVPFPASGVSDLVMRRLGDDLSKLWGQAMIVDNKPGANSQIGTLYAVRSDPDGYTLLSADRSFSLNPLTYDKLPYSKSDVVPVAMLYNASLVLAVPIKSNIKSVQELIAAGKSKPNSLNYGSFGKGSFTHIDTEIFLKQAGFTATHIPYKGVAEVMTALQTGDVDFAFTATGLSTPLVKAGKLRVLAYLSTKRYAALPDVPSSGELGLPGSNSWVGVFAPAATPIALVNKISRDMQQILSAPGFADKCCTALALDVTYLNAQQFAKYLDDEGKALEQAVKGLDVKQQ